MNQSKLFKHLMGTWDFHRAISHQKKDASLGHVIGVVTLTKIDETTLHYQEKGVLTTELDAQINTHREYIYKYCPIEQTIEKFFSLNGKPTKFFYRLNFKEKHTQTALTADAFHLCHQDHYKASYVFFDDEACDRFVLTYQITGPKKAYITTTVFERTPSIPLDMMH